MPASIALAQASPSVRQPGVQHLRHAKHCAAESILARLQHVQPVPVENTVLPQHLPEGEGVGPSTIVHTLPAGRGHVHDVSVCEPPLAARGAGVQA